MPLVDTNGASHAGQVDVRLEAQDLKVWRLAKLYIRIQETCTTWDNVSQWSQLLHWMHHVPGYGSKP
jgi:hypothetical protein